MHAAELAAKFRIPGVEFADTKQGLVAVRVSRGGMSGELFLQGAQVTGWQPAGQLPVIFTSAHAVFAPGKAIRGGIPVIFPWFGAHPTAPAAPQHGFARAAEWQLDAVEQGGAGEVTLALSLDVAATASPWWPHAAGLTLRVTFGQELHLELAVENRSGQPIEFEEALHSYFAVCDVAAVSLFGLEDCEFIDKTAGMRRSAPARTPVSLTGWTDRVYLDTPDNLLAVDPGWRRRITVAKEGGASTIVWNPWPEKAAAMSDLGADQWQGMICVESGNVADNRIRLAQGGTHRLVTRISVVGE